MKLVKRQAKLLVDLISQARHEIISQHALEDLAEIAAHRRFEKGIRRLDRLYDGITPGLGEMYFAQERDLAMAKEGLLSLKYDMQSDNEPITGRHAFAVAQKVWYRARSSVAIELHLETKNGVCPYEALAEQKSLLEDYE